jgi:AcrR family transcriptional regulator
MIADRVGVTPGSLYNYFVDKDDLFLASLTNVWDEFALGIQVATDNQQIPYSRRARDLFVQAEGLLVRAHSLLAGSFSSVPRRARVQADLDRICAKLVPFFEEGRQLGVKFPPADAAASQHVLRLLLAGALWTLALVDGVALQTELGRLRQLYFAQFDEVQP